MSDQLDDEYMYIHSYIDSLLVYLFFGMCCSKKLPTSYMKAHQGTPKQYNIHTPTYWPSPSLSLGMSVHETLVLNI